MTTIQKLASTSGLLGLGALTSLYVGSRYVAVAPAPPPENVLAHQFGGDAGDGWMLFGGFLVIVALAVAFAAAMMWKQEKE